MKCNQPKKANKKKYECIACNYVTNNKKDFNKHCLTKKHKINLIESAFGEGVLANSGQNITVKCPNCQRRIYTSTQ